ncbi:MAG TPA: hypothetical protein VGC41_28180, partial [Kofleriaceae bacterium]
MQLTRALVAMLSLAACGDDTKLAIQVAAPDGVVTVELLIDDHECTDCDGGIGPPSTPDRVLGNVHVLAEDARFSATVDSDGLATFGLTPSETGSPLVGRLAVVGYDATDQPIALYVDDTGFDLSTELGQIRRYELAPTQIDAKQSNTSGVVLWRADPATAACLAIETDPQHVEFFVPPTDPDCDGVTGAAECDAHWYDYKQASADQACTAVDPTGACELGEITACEDGKSAGGCEPQNKFCFGDAECSDAQCAGNPFACIDLARLTMLPFIECTIPITVDAAMNKVCPGAAGLAFSQNRCSPSFMSLAPPKDTGTTLVVNPSAEVAGTIEIVNVLENDCSFQLNPSFNPGLTLPTPARSLYGAISL